LTVPVPEIRFPEFGGEWKRNLIGDVLTIASGKDYKNLGLGEVPVYGTGGLMTYVDDFLYDGESVGIGRKGTIDKPVYLTGKFWTVDTLFYTHSFKEVMPKLIYAVFQRTNWKRYNEASGVPSLSKKTIDKIEISLPSLPEQKKIAAFLSAVDDKLAAVEAQLAGWRNYKRGMMQALFSQTLRFKADDGSDFPDWKEVKLGSIASFKKGKGISKADIVLSGGQKCIRYGELYTTYDEAISEVVSFTETPPHNPVMSQRNDILMPTSDVTPTGLATASALSEEGVVLGGDILVIRSEKILNIWFAYWVGANKKIVMRLASGATVYHVYGSDMATIKFSLPSLAEQQKIADALSAIDAKIEALTARLEATREFKRGLLQKMFV